MAKPITNRDVKAPPPPVAMDIAAPLHGLITSLIIVEAVVITVACALDGKAADQLPELSRVLRRCAGDPLFEAIDKLRELGTEAKNGVVQAERGDS